jgi:hypothetical protein
MYMKVRPCRWSGDVHHRQRDLSCTVSQCRGCVEHSHAQANTTRLTYLNNKKLFNQHIIGQYELETALNSYKTAEAQVAQARQLSPLPEETLSWCSGRAPASGVVGDLPLRKVRSSLLPEHADHCQ